MQAVLCIVHCNKVSKPVKGKYLLLRMNSIMYLLLTWYTLIMFLKVLSHLILKIRSFMKYLKKGVLKYFKMFMKFSNISKWNISSCISTRSRLRWLPARFFRAMLCKRGQCRHAVSVSVCASVCLSRSYILPKHIDFFSPSGSHTILIFPYQKSWQYSDRNPATGGGSNAGGVG